MTKKEEIKKKQPTEKLDKIMIKDENLIRQSISLAFSEDKETDRSFGSSELENETILTRKFTNKHETSTLYKGNTERSQILNSYEMGVGDEHL